MNDSEPNPLRALRERADADFTDPQAEREPGRHSLDVAELGLRVSITRALYPNRPDGRDQYAVTVSRIRVDGPPDPSAVAHVLGAAFGDAAGSAVERSSGPAVRMFRVPATVRGPGKS